MSIESMFFTLLVVGIMMICAEIFVPGGRLADGRPTSVVEAYSPANDAWRQVGPLPRPVAGGLVLSQNGLLYLLGGWDGQAYLNGGWAVYPTPDGWVLHHNDDRVLEAPTLNHLLTEARENLGVYFILEEVDQ